MNLPPLSVGLASPTSARTFLVHLSERLSTSRSQIRNVSPFGAAMSNMVQSCVAGMIVFAFHCLPFWLAVSPRAKFKDSIMMVFGLHQKVVRRRRLYMVDCLMDGWNRGRM